MNGAKGAVKGHIVFPTPTGLSTVQPGHRCNRLHVFSIHDTPPCSIHARPGVSELLDDLIIFADFLVDGKQHGIKRENGTPLIQERVGPAKVPSPAPAPVPDPAPACVPAPVLASVPAPIPDPVPDSAPDSTPAPVPDRASLPGLSPVGSDPSPDEGG